MVFNPPRSMWSTKYKKADAKRNKATYTRTYNNPYNNPHEVPHTDQHTNAPTNQYVDPHANAYIPSIRLDKDVVPLSQFRARVAESVQQVTETGRPLLVTLRGRGIVVVLDVREFEMMREQLAAALHGAAP